MSGKEIIYVLVLITLFVYTPILWLSYRAQRPLLLLIILLLGNLAVIWHFFSTMQQVASSHDPQAGMGAGLYIVASLAIFAMISLTAILVFFFRR